MPTPQREDRRLMVWLLSTFLGILLVASAAGGLGASSQVATPTPPDMVPTGLWELQAIISSGGHEVVPANPANYTVQFFPGERSVTSPKDQEDPYGDPDGRIGLHIDCNLGSADYLVDGNRMTITFIVSTNMGCRPLTLGQTFVDRLYDVSAYRLDGDELTFELESGGRLRFAPARPMPAAMGSATIPARGIVPTECQAAPRPLANLDAERGVAGAAPATPPARVIAVSLGPAAPETTIAAITKTAFGYLACRNAGDLPRAAAFLTDAGARRILSDAAVIRPDPRAAPASPPAGLLVPARTRLVALTDISILTDGRAAALAVLNDPLSLPHGRQTVLLFFVREGDRWLIDDLIGFGVPTVSAATPAAGMPTR